MNTKLHTDGSFQAVRQAIDDARQAFAGGGADHHRDALQHLGRVVMNSLAEIIETDGGTDGPTASPRISRIVIKGSSMKKKPRNRTTQRGNLLRER
ncbi:hypothetical protein IB279_17055 [Ensifer sp. ENS06]|uniref:hypothetical protein n=1 Tax=Ensifer TaxID=106591 RepID=UPI0003F8B4C0|nr:MULTISPECIES: hypothetical protein [unclassified Ensifer]MBD9524876.1 hypothetical protein [Ensifer sp. ENS02]MBD9624660.1 hypothetical protein [Ensifer sp. ENS06]